MVIYMDKNIRNISKDIRSGRLPEENIPRMFNYLADYYHTYAEIRLAMHYYAFYESFCDEEGTWNKEAMEYTDKINLLIRDSVLVNRSGAEREKAIHKIDLIRKEIMERMDALTAFTDIFQTYEYVLNRLEYRFKGSVQSFDEEDFAKEILRYIFNSDDNFIINEKIKDMVGQLPVRITRQKYFELLEESIQAYLGADESALDTYLYMIRTSAMLYNENNMEILYPSLWEKKEQLSRIAYKDISKADYNKALSYLQAATLTLETETTVYLGLQEIVNEVYTLLLCSPYTGMAPTGNEEVKEAAFDILKEINTAFVGREQDELSDLLIEKFTDLEGIQEEMSYSLSEMEDTLYYVKENSKSLIQSMMLEQFLQILLRSGKLLSDSLFINLEDDSQTSEVADEERIAHEISDLKEKLGQVFDSNDRMVSRAVMANTMNKMPVFFADHKEVMDYVRYSIERCSDVYEKAACYEIINAIMKAE